MSSLADQVADNLLVRKAEREVSRATSAAYRSFLDEIVAAVRQGEDVTADVWERAVDVDLLPALREVFARAYDTQATALRDTLSAATPRTSTEARENAERYLRTVRNRLLDIPDDLFRTLRRSLAEGIAASESDEELAARVRALVDVPVRANRIARTETTPALNAGRLQAARAVARETGVSTRGWAKEWVSMQDERVRHTHALADGQTVPLNRHFRVGEHSGRYPGDPRLPPGETINCRCTLRIEARGSLTAAGADDSHDGAVIVALPHEADPIRNVGEEDKHLTLCWMGDSTESTADHGLIRDALKTVAAHTDPFNATVTKTGSLGDDGAHVAFLDPGAPTRVRDLLLAQQPIQEAVGSVQQFPNYTPHVTLSYDDAPDYDGTVTFDRLALWWGDNHGDIYPLGSNGVASTSTGQEYAMDDDTDYGDLDPETSIPWHGVLAPEAVMSGDRRKFSEGALSFRDLPVPLHYQDATASGHDGAVRVANILQATRADQDGTPLIRAWGMFDTHETADEAIRQIAKQMLRGVSVDVDSAEFSFEDEFGNDVGDKSPMEVPNPVMVLTAGRVSGATLCSIPAFQEAYVALGPPPEEWGFSVDGELAAWVESDIEDVLAEADTYATVEFAISDKPWSDFTQADYTDEQWKRACVLDKGEGEGKQRYGLPIREPSGALNRNAVHAAAGRFNQVHASDEAKAKAARALRGAYRTLKEDPPEVLTAAGGRPRDDLLDSDEVPGQRGEGGGKPRVSTKPWSDFSIDDYTDEQWARATALHYKAGYSANKKDHALPYREPNGAFNVEGARKAAGDYPDIKASGEAKAAARRRLQHAFDIIGEDPPAAIARSAEEKTSGQVEEFLVDDSGIPGVMPKKLKAYWTHGEGAAKIAWGTGGDFERCRTNLAAYVPTHMLSGLCAKLHKAATGTWPGRGQPHALDDGIAGPALTSRCEPCEAGLTASASVSSDFVSPRFDRLTPLTVTPDDRVFGHLAGWGTCHIGFDGVCVTPPQSSSDYAYFHTGEVRTGDDWKIAVGHITMGTGHAAASLRAAPAMEHYDNTGCVVADVCAGEDEFGIWVAGRLRPGVTSEQKAALAAAALSGDWRRVGGSMELVAALAVNVPGFPIPRLRAAMEDHKPAALVASGIVTGTGPASGSVTEPESIGRAIGDFLRRQRRAEAARATVDAEARHARRLRARAAVEAVLAAGEGGQ